MSYTSEERLISIGAFITMLETCVLILLTLST